MQHRILIASLWIALVGIAPAQAQDRPSWAAKPAPAATANAVDPEVETGIREVTASSHSLIPLTTKLRYTSLIVLPDGEDIMDVVCGDAAFWVITVTQNMAHIKPSKAGAETNLNLVTASGAVYSFLLHERTVPVPDLKVRVLADPTTAAPARKYYSTAQYDALQGELVEARARADQERNRAEDRIASFKRQLPASLQFTYGPWKHGKPFFVRAIWHDDAFTYIRADTKELPALYEVKDGQPSLVNFQVQDGLYVVPKVIDQGYLALGKERFPFSQQASERTR